MLRVLRTTVKQTRRTCGASFFASNVKRVVLFDRICPPSQTSRFTFLRNLSCPESSLQGKIGSLKPTQREPNDECRTHDALRSHESSDDCESSKSGAASEIEYDDEDEEDWVAECGEDSPADPSDEVDEDCAIDMSNVPEELKEMLEDGFEIDTAEEDLSFEGTAELLTIDEVKQVLEEVRARDVQIFSVQDRCEWTDVMVVATGFSDRHVHGIADALVYKIKKKGNIESPLYPTIEGQVGGKWLVVDCGNIVIHVLNEDSRAYYRLEDLWTGDVKPSTTDEDLENMLKQAGLKDVVP